MFDLPLAVSGQQALYFDEMKALYSRSVVNGVKISVQVLEYNTAKQLVLQATIAAPFNPAPAFANIATATADKNTKVFTFDARVAGSQQQATFTKYINVGQFLGRSIKGSDEYAEDEAELNDNQGISFVLWGQHVDGSNTTAVKVCCRIQVTQYVTFSNLKAVADTIPV